MEPECTNQTGCNIINYVFLTKMLDSKMQLSSSIQEGYFLLPSHCLGDFILVPVSLQTPPRSPNKFGFVNDELTMLLKYPLLPDRQ